ncbi:hypothetical protein ACIQXA_08355 [Streptomyces massasporeus]|uniref:hypothetical protein n=1 Tax=Streptomyces massasporeus TaxID=67324 RepID=UPI0037FEEDE7
MPRIKLANWYGDKAPGEELDVDEVWLKALRRDGMVAEVLGYEGGGTLQPASVEVANHTEEPKAVAPEGQPGRRKR